jgi:hypothetical protein
MRQNKVVERTLQIIVVAALLLAASALPVVIPQHSNAPDSLASVAAPLPAGPWVMVINAQNSSGVTSPAPGATINGDVPILGTAVIDPFQKYELHYKQEPSGDDAFIYFAGGTSPVLNGQLGVWQAGALPGGTYTIRLRVVKVDGNYAEFFSPNLSVNQSAAPPTPMATLPVTPTATPTFTPAPQPTAVVGQVTQPQVEGDEPATATPGAVAAAPDAANPAAVQPTAGGLLPTATPLSFQGGTTQEEGDSLTRQLGESLAFERLRTQFFNGMRISAAIFIGFIALLAGKRLFEWVWRKYG